MPTPPLDGIPRSLTPDERGAVLLQLGIMIQEVGDSYGLGVDVQEVIVRHLMPERPDISPEGAHEKLYAMFAELDDIRRMVFDKNPETQKWQLAIAWGKDAE